MEPKEIASYIEGTPYISVIPTEPGLTNAGKKEGQRLIGINSESAELHEGVVRFDIVCYVRMKDGVSQIIVNVEAQKDEPQSYEILNRAIFYVSRLISSQKERDFENSSYNDIKRVYSIWVCMNMEENIMNHIHLTDDRMLGSYEWKGKLDLLNIIMIGLGKHLAEHDEPYELHRLLGTLLSQDLEADEKLNIIGSEYNIPIEESIREDVSLMCNLSQGIKEEGIAIGESRGETRGIAIGESRGIAIGESRGIAIGEAKIILAMYQNGFTAEQIAIATDKTIEDVKAILEGTAVKEKS